jgi:CRP-like cAMP-binding protein
LLTFIDPPDWFGELALFDSDPRTHDAVAALDTVLLFLPQSSLEALLTIKPVYWRDFGIMLSNKLRLSFGLIEDMALLPASKRLTKRIFLMAENAALNQIRCDLVINVDQASLAAMLSISRQTANQILRGLEERGVISLEYGKIKVRDLEALKLAAMPS